jgi:hypothetical protein
MNPVEYTNNLFKKISLLDKTSDITTTKGDSLRFIYVLYMLSSLVFQSKELQTESHKYILIYLLRYSECFYVIKF